jgi:c-di-GMP phosphodiesterase
MYVPASVSYRFSGVLRVDSLQQESEQGSEDVTDNGGGDLDTLRQQVRSLEERNSELQSLLDHDPYTGLQIHRVFERDLDRALTNAASGNGHGDLFLVGLIRLDASYERIKNSRDRNRVLLFKTAQRIVDTLNCNVYQSDRLDEFLFFIPKVKGSAKAVSLLERVWEEVATPHEGPANDIVFGCHIGVSFWQGEEESRSEVLGNANIALEECVRQGTRVIVYTEEMGQAYRFKAAIERKIARTIRSGFDDFRIMYQPLVNSDAVICGAEALIRWFDPELGQISPGVFIPITEETGDVRFIGQWMLYNSCRQLKQWHLNGYTDLYISINVAPPQFKQPDLVERITGMLDSLKLNGGHVKLEVTEGAIMERPETAIVKMEELREYGVRISVDDFGTGYSSLNYLKKFPIDTLKIDRSFIEDVTENTSNQGIVRAIISMARNLGIETLAEGVETLEQVDFLLDAGCEMIQGYYYSRPVPSAEFDTYLSSGARLPLTDPGMP